MVKLYHDGKLMAQKSYSSIGRESFVIEEENKCQKDGYYCIDSTIYRAKIYGVNSSSNLIGPFTLTLQMQRTDDESKTYYFDGYSHVINYEDTKFNGTKRWGYLYQYMIINSAGDYSILRKFAFQIEGVYTKKPDCSGTSRTVKEENTQSLPIEDNPLNFIPFYNISNYTIIEENSIGRNLYIKNYNSKFDSISSKYIYKLVSIESESERDFDDILLTFSNSSYEYFSDFVNITKGINSFEDDDIEFSIDSKDLLEIDASLLDMELNKEECNFSLDLDGKTTTFSDGDFTFTFKITETESYYSVTCEGRYHGIALYNYIEHVYEENEPTSYTGKIHVRDNHGIGKFAFISLNYPMITEFDNQNKSFILIKMQGYKPLNEYTEIADDVYEIPLYPVYNVNEQNPLEIQIPCIADDDDNENENADEYITFTASPIYSDSLENDTSYCINNTYSIQSNTSFIFPGTIVRDDESYVNILTSANTQMKEFKISDNVRLVIGCATSDDLFSFIAINNVISKQMESLDINLEDIKIDGFRQFTVPIIRDNSDSLYVEYNDGTNEIIDKNIITITSKRSMKVYPICKNEEESYCLIIKTFDLKPGLNVIEYGSARGISCLNSSHEFGLGIKSELISDIEGPVMMWKDWEGEIKIRNIEVKQENNIDVNIIRSKENTTIAFMFNNETIPISWKSIVESDITTFLKTYGIQCNEGISTGDISFADGSIVVNNKFVTEDFSTNKEEIAKTLGIDDKVVSEVRINIIDESKEEEEKDYTVIIVSCVVSGVVVVAISIVVFIVYRRKKSQKKVHNSEGENQDNENDNEQMDKDGINV